MTDDPGIAKQKSLAVTETLHGDRPGTLLEMVRGAVRNWTAGHLPTGHLRMKLVGKSVRVIASADRHHTVLSAPHGLRMVGVGGKQSVPSFGAGAMRTLGRRRFRALPAASGYGRFGVALVNGDVTASGARRQGWQFEPGGASAWAKAEPMPKAIELEPGWRIRELVPEAVTRKLKERWSSRMPYLGAADIVKEATTAGLPASVLNSRRSSRGGTSTGSAEPASQADHRAPEGGGECRHRACGRSRRPFKVI
jgi:hypothetical protein